MTVEAPLESSNEKEIAALYPETCSKQHQSGRDKRNIV
jgi:hypothetical protein